MQILWTLNTVVNIGTVGFVKGVTDSKPMGEHDLNNIQYYSSYLTKIKKKISPGKPIRLKDVQQSRYYLLVFCEATTAFWEILRTV